MIKKSKSSEFRKGLGVEALELDPVRSRRKAESFRACISVYEGPNSSPVWPKEKAEKGRELILVHLKVVADRDRKTKNLERKS